MQEPQLLRRARLQVSSDRGRARRAGTTRPAIYRRWSGRPALVLAAIGDRLATPDAPDTGCTLCDVFDSLGVFLTAYRTLRPTDLSALYADRTDHELRARYLAAIVEPARSAVGRTLERAGERGDLRQGVDTALLRDLVGAPVHYRATLGEAFDDEDADGALEILQGAAQNYDALLAHAEAIEHHHVSGHPDGLSPR